jgi:hypothetical protein
MALQEAIRIYVGFQSCSLAGGTNSNTPQTIDYPFLMNGLREYLAGLFGCHLRDLTTKNFFPSIHLSFQSTALW